MKRLFKIDVSAVVEFDSEKFLDVNPKYNYYKNDDPFYLRCKNDITGREFADVVKRNIKEWYNNCSSGKDYDNVERSHMVNFILASKIFDHDLAGKNISEDLKPQMKISVFNGSYSDGEKYSVIWDVDKILEDQKPMDQKRKELNDKLEVELDKIDAKMGVNTKCQK